MLKWLTESHPWRRPALTALHAAFALMLVSGTQASLAEQAANESEEPEAHRFTVLRKFDPASDVRFVFGLTVDAQGTLYGVSAAGTSGGTTFALTREGSYVVAPPPFPVRGAPIFGSHGLILDAQGNLVIAAPVTAVTDLQDLLAGRNSGGVFKQNFNTFELTTLHQFTGFSFNSRTGDPSDGRDPAVNVISDAAGNFYGTTLQGDAVRPDAPCGLLEQEFGGCGIVYKIDGKTTKETILHSFTLDDGWNAYGLTRDQAGTLYGSTLKGGDLSCRDGEFGIEGCGVIFRINAAGAFEILHSFTHRPLCPFVFCQGGPPPPPGPETLGDNPGLIAVDEDGEIFGTTFNGGNFGLGVIFRVDRSGRYTVLHHFAGPIDGWDTEWLELHGHKLYGANGFGGDIINCGFGGGCGTVWVMNIDSGKFSVLHTFSDINLGGGAIALAVRDKKLYGSTAFGGDMSDPTQCDGIGCGTLFTIELDD